MRGYEHSSSDATQIELGALAGSLIGTGISVLASTGPRGSFALVTAGAIAGALTGHRMTSPAPARDRTPR